MRSGASTKTPCSSGTQGDGSPLSCLLSGNGETKGSPPEGLARVRSSCFCLATECLLKTHQALWERGQLTPLISSAGRDRVSPPEQHLTQSDPPATHRKLLSAVLNGASVLPKRRLGPERSSVSRLSHRRSFCQPPTVECRFQWGEHVTRESLALNKKVNNRCYVMFNTLHIFIMTKVIKYDTLAHRDEIGSFL